ncbi:HlyD family efflux transporter periplasmic adaptor subunit [Clostridium cochlearium]|uniref:efflux RND transporter periplasmic adaptor subunit n=1 Tax=Clostridium cochlearium TaxID=1494 RepID=UPI001799347D|nr:HlyD family efflux transporter periplasmic adaptor subunit [Clostridium cochlearium]MBU5269935.1 biotin/lipoyl-binding protein [Clostridium cochlearium]NMA58221.1 biotin/lipoyl-binding protein [Clostridium cochlearium]
MKKKFKLNKKALIFGTIGIVVLLIAFSTIRGKKDNLTQVTVDSVSKKNLSKVATATGNVEANYRNDIVLNPSLKVVKVNFKEGQMVKKDDILVELDSKDLQIQLEKAELNLKNANDTLAQLQGAEVENQKKTASNSLIQAKLSLDNAKNSYEDLSKKLSQNKKLFEGGYISQNEYDASVKATKEAENGVKNAEASLKNAENNLSAIDISTNNKITAQRNQIAMIQSDIKSIKDKIEDCHIKANVSGKIVRMDAKEGQNPANGDMIIIDDVSKYKVTADINQYDAVNIKKGQKVNIKLKGVEKEYKGKIEEVGEVAEKKMAQSGASMNEENKLNIKVNIDKPDNKVKAGYEADLEIILKEKNGSLAIGFDAIRQDKKGGKKYIYVVDNGNVVKKKEVKTGLETEYDVEILSGLKEGEKYVVNPPENLKDGEKIKLAVE